MNRAIIAFACAAAGFAPAQQFVADTDPGLPSFVTSDAGKPVAGARGWFRAWDSSFEAGLYATDGTVAGTRRVLDGPVVPLHEFAGRLLFTNVNTSQTGTGLYSTDGTPGGTVQLVHNIATVTVLGECNGRLIFSDIASTSVASRIWSTDMTPGGTVFLGQFFGTPFGTSLGNELLLFGRATGFAISIYATDGVYFVPRFTFPAGNDLSSNTAAVLGGHAYFVARSIPGGPTVTDELWRTDGTTVTTVTVLGPYSHRQLARAGTGLVIAGDAGTTTTLFSDGTAAGTTVMTSQVRGTNFKTVGSLAFFTGSEATNGTELWRTDGTAAGTFLLMDATPGPGSSWLSSLTAGVNTLYCFVDYQDRLLGSDGTIAGTRLFAQQVLPTSSSGGLAVLGDTALVVAQVGGQIELLAADVATASPVQVSVNVLRPGMRGPFFAAPLLDKLCFVNDGAQHGRELWRSDGTPGGTFLVEDIAPGPADAVGELIGFDGALWFGVGGALYRSDGTAAGRSFVFNTGAPRLDGLQAGTNVVSFRTPVGFGSQLWRSDGLTTVAYPIFLPPSSSPVLHVGDAMYFTVNIVPLPGSRLHRWDGQPAGGVDLGAADRILGRLGQRVVFAAGGTVTITDGTVSGTVALGTLPAGGASAAQGNRRDEGTFLVVVDGLGNVRATDGASFVTLPVSSPTLLAGGDDLVYLQCNDPVAGPVLYATDGTAAGTQLVVDFGSLPTARAVGMWPLGSGNRMLIAVRTDANGVEPWITDGTAAGTMQLADLNPNGSSNPVLLGVAGSLAWFVADDGVTGPELWRLDLSAVAAANVQSLGTGCPGSFGDPRVASGDTPELGTTFTVKLTQANPNSLAIWLFGTQLGEIAVGGGCTLYMQSLDLLFWNLTDSTGAAMAQVAIPNWAPLVGFALIQQVGVFDPLGASPFGTSTSQGLFWLIGN